MLGYHDQLNREINLPSVPKRIISIVPSQTELLFYLGLDEKIVGITKFCIHPADKVGSVEKVGGTKQLDIEKIKALKPDLIIANKEENEQNQVEELINFCPVWISDIYSFDDALDMIERVGALTGKGPEAKILSSQIAQQFNQKTIQQSNLKTAYFIWRKPYMIAGKNTFIDDMLLRCGLVNAFDEDRYPEIDAKTLIATNPDVILLSSEPYPFKDKHIDELRAIVPKAIIRLVDGEMFSWYGSRLSHAGAYFKDLVDWLTKLD
ncbi:ABC transporter substrate-binding protein [Mucilaginibacter gotjawali]|uniref:ABC-type Fe3+-hydroxamate transport system substrate-binding protein n=2 Tax=Mucilaginibacter gotjawali TaxID=1550579 RepID=A0A839SEV6_9SPHI|nr:helical backbone metal receptor [Mucilaginibacter gotjawali]MBB3055823.1 ABC-type Fe3+-hydroxamate transport system substrate-binding protein [Mucilaginibacter gotjawali]BAU54644.1 Vitamin B12-binding protein precursor [Mucilaginibacter gotjawali]